MHRADQKDDPLLQQARIDVVGALAAVGLLDHHRHQVVHVCFGMVGHLTLLNRGSTGLRIAKSITPSLRMGRRPPRPPHRSSIPAASPSAPPPSPSPV